MQYKQGLPVLPSFKNSFWVMMDGPMQMGLECPVLTVANYKLTLFHGQ